MSDRPFTAYEGNEPYVFVSYAHIDDAIVYPEIQWLKDQGFNIWYDEGISPGSEWQQELASRIQNSSLFVFFVTPSSVDSAHCQREVFYAIDQHKAILAVYLEDTQLPQGLSLSLGSTQSISRFELSELDYRIKLLKSTSTHIQRGMAQAQPAQTRPLSPDASSTLTRVVAALVVAVLTGYLGWWVNGFLNHPDAARTTRFLIDVPDGFNFHDEVGQSIAITPDGSRILLTGFNEESQGLLYSRHLTQLEPTLILQTDAALGGIAVSPDSQWVAFFEIASRTIRKISVEGGLVTTICSTGDQGGYIGNSMVWGSDGTIVYATRQERGLMRVSAQGGTPEQLTIAEDGLRHYHPYFLPDESGVMYTIGIDNHRPTGEERIGIVSFASGEESEIAKGGAPRVSRDSRFLFFFRDDQVWALPFNLGQLNAESAEIPVLENVHFQHNAVFSLSDQGTVIYRPVNASEEHTQLLWIDRQGKEELVSLEPNSYFNPRLSPSGDRIATSISTNDESHVWIHLLSRGTSMRMTFDKGTHLRSDWSPDGETIAYIKATPGELALFTKAASGIGQQVQVTKGPNIYRRPQWTPDGKSILASECVRGDNQCDISVISLEDDQQIRKLIATPFNEIEATVSPNGKWVAYSANNSGDFQVYVRPYPDVDSGSLWQISAEGGIQPSWSPDGTELFFVGETELMVATIRTDSAFGFDNPVPIFKLGDFPRNRTSFYDYDHTNDRFLVVRNAPKEATKLVLVQNWLVEIERRASDK